MCRITCGKWSNSKNAVKRYTQKIFEKNLKIYYICREKKSLKFKKIYSEKKIFLFAQIKMSKKFLNFLYTRFFL